MLTPRQIHWLNTPLFNLINYWSLLHLIYGMLWGFTIFSLQSFLVVHFLVQVVEICVLFEGDFQLQDVLIETVLGVVGVMVTKVSPTTSASFIFSFAGLLLSHT